ncbi:hypothetical protein ACSS6W_006344 [Trichoderma asperelloides]|uniref:GPI anchored serine-threonine rich protein n=1 Tax=Trichoderma asperellum TaxID=101201 RepID=A0A6V8QU16_TRIAP|nr:hypothetical protein LI328DRAFT_21141 [Trichoderma asperelloides]GFP56124.1 hypothetical protein TASIC1_0006029400 [Trichoderma asperellum]
MKFLATLLFTAAGVSAATSATSPDTPGSTCLADYILEDCLKSTTTNAGNCSATDYVCLCAAYQAVLTCYNNCPSDIRAPSVQQQVDSYCRTASLLATTTTAHKTKTSGASKPDETSASEASPGNDEATPTGESSGSPTAGGSDETSSSGHSSATAARTTSSKGAAPTMIGNVAGIFMAVAGAAAAAIL